MVQDRTSLKRRPHFDRLVGRPSLGTTIEEPQRRASRGSFVAADGYTLVAKSFARS